MLPSFPAEGHTFELEGWLGEAIGRRVCIQTTNNRRLMIASAERPHHLEVRLHHAFLDASERVWIALALFLSGGSHPEANETLHRFIDTIRVQDERELAKLQPRGLHHDLRPHYERINHEHFREQCTALTTWSRAKVERAKDSRILGSYDAQLNLITMHRRLDDPFVPDFYLRWVLFHEMLHEIYGADYQGGHRHVHPPAFRILEEAFPEREASLRWEREHTRWLMSA